MLCYSQSGISRMIHDLEKEWGVSLLERGRAGVRLTSDGLKLLPFAKSVLDEYQKLQAQVEELNGLQSGLIRIGTFSSVCLLYTSKVPAPAYNYIIRSDLFAEPDLFEWPARNPAGCGFV